MCTARNIKDNFSLSTLNILFGWRKSNRVRSEKLKNGKWESAGKLFGARMQNKNKNHFLDGKKYNENYDRRNVEKDLYRVVRYAEDLLFVREYSCNEQRLCTKHTTMLRPVDRTHHGAIDSLTHSSRTRECTYTRTVQMIYTNLSDAKAYVQTTMQYREHMKN